MVLVDVEAGLFIGDGDGGSGDNYRNVCFKTGAATAINAGGNQNFNGDYRPRQAFSLLNGDQVNGTWNYEIPLGFPIALKKWDKKHKILM